MRVELLPQGPRDEARYQGRVLKSLRVRAVTVRGKYCAQFRYREPDPYGRKLDWG
jgi:hypothetical protein